jgi:AcrR family transcriptional regulator
MPKQVDHTHRRLEISDAAARIATTRGLRSLSFREVAVEAGVSVSLVQHYFGTKEQLVVDTLDIQSGRLGRRILDELNDLAPDAGPFVRIHSMAATFIPGDRERRDAMLLYLGFAGAALTDGALRRAETFRNADALRAAVAGELRMAVETGRCDRAIDPDRESLTILSLVLGLSFAVLLEQVSVADAIAALDAHLDRLGG